MIDWALSTKGKNRRVVGAPQPAASISVCRPPPSVTLDSQILMSTLRRCMSSQHFLCPSLLLAAVTVPCKRVFARQDDQETYPPHFSFRLFAIVVRSSGRLEGMLGPVADLDVGCVVRVSETQDLSIASHSHGLQSFFETQEVFCCCCVFV